MPGRAIASGLKPAVGAHLQDAVDVGKTSVQDLWVCHCSNAGQCTADDRQQRLVDACSLSPRKRCYRHLRKKQRT